MSPSTIQPSTLQFLADLSENNNRDWFAEHKPVYQHSLENMMAFADALLVQMNKHDVIETPSGKKSLLRIYNDVRFSKDKAPYSPRFAMAFRRATKERRGGYYLNIKPGNSFLACGFFGPNSDDLRRIRWDIEDSHEDWLELLNLKGIREGFGGLQGQKVATAPRGYSTNHPAIDLLRHKQFIFRHQFSDADVTDKDFVPEVSRMFKALRPWLNHMSEVLTTDRNGELL